MSLGGERELLALVFSFIFNAFRCLQRRASMLTYQDVKNTISSFFFSSFYSVFSDVPLIDSNVVKQDLKIYIYRSLI